MVDRRYGTQDLQRRLSSAGQMDRLMDDRLSEKDEK